MAISLKTLFHGQPSVAGGTLYTCPNGKVAVILSRIISNPSTADLTARLGRVPSGGLGDGTHYLLADQKIPAKTAYESDTKVILAAGDILEGQSASLPTPDGLAAVSSTTGGTLAAANYFYRITATNANGETIALIEVSVGTSGSTGSVTLTWLRSLGATGYKVYRSTASGTETLIATVTGGNTLTYTDTGSATPSGTAFPTVGSAGGCIFTIGGVELPA